MHKKTLTKITTVPSFGEERSLCDLTPGEYAWTMPLAYDAELDELNTSYPARMSQSSACPLLVLCGSATYELFLFEEK